MEFLIKDDFIPKSAYLNAFIREYWFAPQDVLLRSTEANIIGACRFTHPILDIGIGDGGISRFLFPKNFKIDVGIDLQDCGLKQAKATGVYKKVLRADAQNMPFRSESFRSVVSNSTFEHIKDDVQAVYEVSRVLTKYGYFFQTVPSIYLPKTILSLEGNNNQARKKREWFDNRVSHFHYRSLFEWKSILKKNNLTLVFYKYYFPYETTALWYRLMKISTTGFRNKEVWSYLAHTRLRNIIPEKLAAFVLAHFILRRAYQNSLEAEDGKGCMLFLVSQKL